MRLKAVEAEKEAKRQEAENNKMSKRSMATIHTDFSMLTKIKKRAEHLAKKELIKRTSDYEKGHPWHCNMCGKKNRGVQMACQICGRLKRYTTKRFRPAHGKSYAESIRSVQANFLYKDKDDDDNVNQLDGGKWTPLHNAAISANPGLVEALLNSGAVIEACTAAGFRPLHFACSSNSVNCVEALLHFGAVLNCKTGKSLLTPLHVAAKHGHPDIIKLLVKKEADLHVLDSGLKTPLHYAAMSGHVDAAVVLIKAGADLNTKDADGWSSKQLAEFFGHKTFVEYIFRLEHPGIAMGRIDEFPPQKWHSDVYFHVKEDVKKRKACLAESQMIQAEVQEMLRLYQGGNSFLESSFHAEQTRELTEEESEMREKSKKSAKARMQL